MRRILVELGLNYVAVVNPHRWGYVIRLNFRRSLCPPVEKTTIWSVEIDDSKPMRPAICLGDERRLISQTAPQA